MCERGRGGQGGSGNEEYDNNGDKVNGYKVNGDVLQWRAVTRNGSALTLAVYIWDVRRGVMLWWWDGWVAERADGRCDFHPVILSCLQKMAIWRVD